MSGYLSTYLQSPTQAGDVFTQTGRFPKQKHAFLVRFVMNNNAGDGNLTFAVKSTDRPSITMTIQELNQYNKKRVIYTGYKTNPLKVVFYDTADQAAQGLWATYSRYYFGDFGQSYTAFGDDIETASSNWVANLGSAGFGYTAGNDGQTSFGTQFLIKYIEILQFNGGTYDTYTLINPKITNFDLDELDYGVADISTITMTFAYEAVIYSPGSGGAAASEVEEFQEGQGFYGDPLNVPGVTPYVPTEFYVPNAVSNDSITSDILGGLFSAALGSQTTAPNYGYYNSGTGSGLAAFGNFVFGATVGNAVYNAAGGGVGGAVAASVASNLAVQSISNPALTAALNLSYTSNPAVYPTNPYGAQAGIPSGLYDGVTAISSSATDNAVAASALTAGLLTDALVGNSNGGANTAAGLALTAAAYGAINAQRAGSSQYGYNPQIVPYGYNYGYQGASGYTAPPTPTPSAPAQPFGMYVPAPVVETPLAPLPNVPTPSDSTTGTTIP